ncbi:hypothetical protein BDW59DRAFT_165599 [Aspergillus cavernicola]|uniref:Uncharacterized protein n=1 Tax=Aspergillus cavernicola TaxID=176166 RepID=A0ABR4HRN0_9EURO
MKEDVYDLMFQLGMMSFREAIDMTPIRVLTSFFLLVELKGLALPQYPSFVGFQDDQKSTAEVLLPIIRISYQPLKETKAYKRIKRKPSILLPEWYRNMQLQHHIAKVQTILNAHYKATNHVPLPSAPSNRRPNKETMGHLRRHYLSYPRLGEDLLRKSLLCPTGFPIPIVNTPNLPEQDEPSASDRPRPDMQQAPPPEIAELEGITTALGRPDCSVRSRYAQVLQQSIAAMRIIKKLPEMKDGHRSNTDKERTKLAKEISVTRSEIDTCYSRIRDSLSANNTSTVWLRKENLWPPLTPITILQHPRTVLASI